MLFDGPITVNTYDISPSNVIKFLGVHIDNHLSFSANVDYIIAKTNSRLFPLRLLKILGMDNYGLHTFYCTNIISVLTYAAPAWYFLLSKLDQARLEQVQRHATRIILPDLDYFTRLDILELPMLSDFIYYMSQSLFNKIASNIDHPLHNKIKVNTNRTSSRKPTNFYPARTRTTKRANSYFPYFMSQQC